MSKDWHIARSIEQVLIVALIRQRGTHTHTHTHSKQVLPTLASVSRALDWPNFSNWLLVLLLMSTRDDDNKVYTSVDRRLSFSLRIACFVCFPERDCRGATIPRKNAKSTATATIDQAMREIKCKNSTIKASLGKNIRLVVVVAADRSIIMRSKWNGLIFFFFFSFFNIYPEA